MEYPDPALASADLRTCDSGRLPAVPPLQRTEPILEQPRRQTEHHPRGAGLTTTDDIRATRQKLVLDHFRDEVRQNWDDVLATFPHPHYELIPTMTVHDGDRAVRSYYHDSRVAFPDQDHEIIDLRHSDDAAIVEFWLLGTHLGALGAIPATGSRFRVRMTAYFIFDEDENLVCERVYFDSLTLLKQLIGGLNMRNPQNWLLAARCVRGALKWAAGATPHPTLVNSPRAEMP